MVDDRQKEYQRKYDEKTKTISVKYALCDMSDYDRLKRYLAQTGKSANGFIKELINDFFEHKKYEMNDARVADYFKFYNVDGELLSKLKQTVGNDRFDMIVDYYKSAIEAELYDAYIDKGDSLDEWIEQFLLDVECGDIDIDVSDKEFMRMIDINMSHNIGEVTFHG